MASSSHSIGPVSQQYAAAATVPLIKSPSLWMPKPIELPNDVHPLPDDITAYFVYPFNLETHVLSQHPQPHEAISQQRAKAAAILHQREVEEEQKEKAAMQKKAPGYNPSSVLVPKSVSSPKPDPAATATSSSASGGLEDLIMGGDQGQVGSDPMDDLASQLESLDRGH